MPQDLPEPCVRCTECEAVHPSTPDTLYAAAVENAHSAMLVRATAEGQALLNVPMGDWKDGNH